MARSLGTVVSKEFRDKLKDMYPKAFDTPHRISFLRHVLYLQDECSDDDNEFLSKSGKTLFHKVIKERILGVRDNSFSVYKFVTEFQDCIDFPLNITDYSIAKGLAREFNPELPKELERMLVEELKIPLRSKINPVYFQDGAMHSDKKRSAIRRKMHDDHYNYNKPNGVILSYFENINPISYNPYQENVDNLIEQLVKDSENIPETTLKAHLLHLNALVESLEPYYYEKSPYERVWAEGASLQNVKREHRQEILKGCIEADLTSAHLSIAAYDWNIPSLIELLESGTNIWEYFHSELNLDFSLISKAALKKGIYTIIYGGGLDTIEDKMHDAGLEYDIIQAFLELPLVADIISTSEFQRLIAENDKYIYLAAGSKLYARKAKAGQKAIKPYALVSWRAISIEKALIESCFEVATQYPEDFRILSLEHDGFSFVMLDKSKEKTVWNRLTKAVVAKGKELGIKISLEQK